MTDVQITLAQPDPRDRALEIARERLTRLSYNDEMAGMGQRDADPELIARCRYAAAGLADLNAVLAGKPTLREQLGELENTLAEARALAEPAAEEAGPC
jgi:hypothetical protein